MHASLERFVALADGALLVVPKTGPGAGDLHCLDPGSGALTPWAQAWRPASSGWKVADPAADTGYDPHASPDGNWVALAHVFTPLTAPRPGEDDVFVVVVSRPDGSEARCVGAAILEDEGDPQPFLWTADSRRLIGGWSGRCEPDARGRLQSFADGKKLGAWPRPMRWFEPHDGGRGETPGVWHFESRDPLGDSVIAHSEGKVDGFTFFDLRTGARLGAVPEPAGQVVSAGGWLTADALLVDLLGEPARDLVGHRIYHTDGRDIAGGSTGWWVYTRLASGEVLFTRDSGESIEQGRIDPTTFEVTTSRPRADLARFARPFQRSRHPESWTPALGGVLIHERDTGELWFAAI